MRKYGLLLTPVNKSSPKLKGALHKEVVYQGKNTSMDQAKKEKSCKIP
jgi:hypothetical protein